MAESRVTITIGDLPEIKSALEDAATKIDELRAELAARRACLEGARQTLEAVAATLSNAETIGLARTTLGVPVQERIELVDEAIASTDAALGGGDRG